MNSPQDEIVQEFLVESRETLDRLDQDLIALENAPHDSNLINSIFRGIHTIKGTCGFLEYSKLEMITHVGESLLDSVRAGKVPLSPEITTALLELLDASRAILANIEREGHEGVEEYHELRDRLVALNTAPASSERSLEEEFEAILAENRAAEAARRQSTQPIAIHEAPAEHGDGEPSSHRTSAPSPSVEGERRSEANESSLRVDVHLLDQLMNLVGELVLARNQILQLTKQHTDPALLGTTQRLNLITSELQESVMKTRMQPIANVWNKFPRVVRDVARVCGKRVRIEMQGKETELDKTIIESIKDPLTHILRNSIDHGIESPEQRELAGKDPEGTLSLRAYHDGGNVIIEVRDDGAGLPTERIREKAIERGLLSAERAAQLNDSEIHRLIFQPGFSTADAVTNISGRGVGMDVVRSNIERIGGAVDVSSESGVGTTIRVTIPLTLAIIPALIVSSGGQRFAIPQVNLVELVRIPGERRAHEIERIAGAEFYRLRGDLLPLVSLNKVLHLRSPEVESPDDDDALNIIVVRSDRMQFGLMVDALHDTEEIVVKPLSIQLQAISLYSGATIMGDGRVALIIDVTGLASHAGVAVAQGAIEALERGSEPEEELEPRVSLLVVDVGARRLGVPLHEIQRLEEFSDTQIEASCGQEVVQYRGGILPLIDLRRIFCEPVPDREPLRHVVVHASSQEPVGLVVDQVVDIIETPLRLHPRGDAYGVEGSAIVAGAVTDILSLSQLLEHLPHPNFSASTQVLEDRHA